MDADTSTKEHWTRFGEWLTARRNLLGKSQTDMAIAAGMDRSQWHRIESGKSGTKRVTIPRIAAAVQADLEETYKRAGFDTTFDPAESTTNDNLLSILSTLSEADKEFIQNLAFRLQDSSANAKPQKLPVLNEGEELVIVNRNTGCLYTINRESIAGDNLIEILTLLASTVQSDFENNAKSEVEVQPSNGPNYVSSTI